MRMNTKKAHINNPIIASNGGKNNTLNTFLLICTNLELNLNNANKNKANIEQNIKNPNMVINKPTMLCVEI